MHRDHARKSRSFRAEALEEVGSERRRVTPRITSTPADVVIGHGRVLEHGFEPSTVTPDWPVETGGGSRGENALRAAECDLERAEARRETGLRRMRAAEAGYGEAFPDRPVSDDG